MKKSEKKGRARAPSAVMENAGRRFGERRVLSGVDLEIVAGETVGVVGPNGGGKSTLLLLLAGLLAPTEGTVHVCGKPACSVSREASGLIGLVTARPGLYPLLSGRENLHHFGGLFGLSARQVDEKAAPLLDALELEKDIDARAARMSTGMQQKVSLVRALLLSPALLLFDEPTANLDPVASQTLYKEVRRRADQGLACVIVTHDLFAAESVCDRVLLVDGTVKKTLSFANRQAPPSGPILAAWRKTLVSR